MKRQNPQIPRPRVLGAEREIEVLHLGTRIYEIGLEILRSSPSPASLLGLYSNCALQKMIPKTLIRYAPPVERTLSGTAQKLLSRVLEELISSEGGNNFLKHSEFVKG